MELKTRLKEWRSKLGLSQEGAARRIGVTLGTYARWEAGKHEPGGLALERLNQLIAEDPGH